MDNLFNMTLGFISLTILLVAYNTNFNHTNRGSTKEDSKQCTKEIYYFQDEHLDFVPADRQQFRILFTGQVANAYFYKNGKEYSTTNYYKQIEQGKLQGYNCIRIE